VSHQRTRLGAVVHDTVVLLAALASANRRRALGPVGYGGLRGRADAVLPEHGLGAVRLPFLERLRGVPLRAALARGASSGLWLLARRRLEHRGQRLWSVDVWAEGVQAVLLLRWIANQVLPT